MSQTKAIATARLHQDKACPACPLSGFSSNLRYQTSCPLCYLPSPCNCSCLVAWRLGLVFFLAPSSSRDHFSKRMAVHQGCSHSAPMYGLMCLSVCHRTIFRREWPYTGTHTKPRRTASTDSVYLIIYLHVHGLIFETSI